MHRPFIQYYDTVRPGRYYMPAERCNSIAYFQLRYEEKDIITAEYTGDSYYVSHIFFGTIQLLYLTIENDNSVKFLRYEAIQVN